MNDFLDFLAEFVKNVLKIPDLLKAIFDLLWSLVGLVPDPFGSILNIFIPIYIGIIVWKLWRG